MIRNVAMFVTDDLQAVIHKKCNICPYGLPSFQISLSWFQWFICYRHQTRSQRRHAHEGHLVIL